MFSRWFWVRVLKRDPMMLILVLMSVLGAVFVAALGISVYLDKPAVMIPPQKPMASAAARALAQSLSTDRDWKIGDNSIYNPRLETYISYSDTDLPIDGRDFTPDQRRHFNGSILVLRRQMVLDGFRSSYGIDGIVPSPNQDAVAPPLFLIVREDLIKKKEAAKKNEQDLVQEITGQ